MIHPLPAGWADTTEIRAMPKPGDRTRTKGRLHLAPRIGRRSAPEHAGAAPRNSRSTPVRCDRLDASTTNCPNVPSRTPQGTHTRAPPGAGGRPMPGTASDAASADSWRRRIPLRPQRSPASALNERGAPKCRYGAPRSGRGPCARLDGRSTLACPDQCASTHLVDRLTCRSSRASVAGRHLGLGIRPGWLRAGDEGERPG